MGLDNGKGDGDIFITRDGRGEANILSEFFVFIWDGIAVGNTWETIRF